VIVTAHLSDLQRPVWWAEQEDGWRVEVKKLVLDDGEFYRGFVTPPGRPLPIAMTIPFESLEDADAVTYAMLAEWRAAGAPKARPRWWRRAGAWVLGLFAPRGAS